MRKQLGATFISWVAIASLAIFGFITVVKIAPVYLEFYSIKKMVDDIALNPLYGKVSKTEVQDIVTNFLNVNNIKSVDNTSFVLEQDPKNSSRKLLKIEYEVRKPWFYNIEFLMTFKHSAILGNGGTIEQ